jgi:quercetin dioxygenase-like cupin family protein
MLITHHFSSGMYMKEANFDAGEWSEKHVHSHDHLSVLCSGIARVTIDGEPHTMRGPRVLTIKAGKVHQVFAITALTWLCTHATDETDPEKIDMALIAEGS